MTTHWAVRHCDLLDVPADVLVCSANVYLTLSGGVGGAFLLRYGTAMQEALADHLAQRGLKHVERGDLIVMPPFGSPYRAVLHAVAVDGFYDTTIQVVADLIRESLRHAAQCGAETVALAALATGYGRKSMEFFAEAVNRVIDDEVPPIRRVVVGLRGRHDVDELLAAAPRLTEA